MFLEIDAVLFFSALYSVDMKNNHLYVYCTPYTSNGLYLSADKSVGWIKDCYQIEDFVCI